MFAVFLSLSGYVLSLSYSSNLYSFLTLTQRPSPPHRMESLADVDGMRVGTTSVNNRDELRGSVNPKIRRLADRFDVLGTWQEGMERVEGGSFAFMNSKISSEYNIRTRFANRLLGIF